MLVNMNSLVYKVGAICVWTYGLTVVAGNASTISMLPEFSIAAYFWLGFFPTIIPLAGGIALYYLGVRVEKNAEGSVSFDCSYQIYEIAVSCIGIVFAAIGIIGFFFLIGLIAFDHSDGVKGVSNEDWAFFVSDIARLSIGVVFMARRKAIAHLLSS